jgi:hypothetical protein
VPDLSAITAFATIDRRRDEPGLLAVIREHGAPLHCYPAASLDAADVPSLKPLPYSQPAISAEDR